jgi:predicted metal-dependent hydrolase
MVKKVNINDLEIEYKTDYRNIKYPRLEFKTGKLLLILPKDYKDEIELIQKHKEWIYKKFLMIDLAKREAKNKKIESIDEKELKNLIINLVAKFSKETNIKVNKIYFKELNSKWGSCSSKGNLTFNILLKYLPKPLIKYVVFHEIVHLKEKKHNERFWCLVSKKFKNYAKKEKELLVYWFLVQEIIHSN